MDRRRLAVLSAAVLLIAVVTMSVAVSSGAAGATSGTLSIDAATMSLHADSTHDSDCAPFTADAGREFQGTVNTVGALFGSVNVPQGARIRSLRLVVRDSDLDLNAHAYLARKRMAPAPGLEGFSGYKVLANVNSAGASSLLRRFTDLTVVSGRVDNSRFGYYVELVNCADTVDPIGVQVTWTKP